MNRGYLFFVCTNYEINKVPIIVASDEACVSCWFYERCFQSHTQMLTITISVKTYNLGRVVVFYSYGLFKSIYFLLIELHYTFSICYIVLTYYAYYYCVPLGAPFSGFFAGFLLFSPNGAVKVCDSSLGSLLSTPRPWSSPPAVQAWVSTNLGPIFMNDSLIKCVSSILKFWFFFKSLKKMNELTGLTASTPRPEL